MHVFVSIIVNIGTVKRKGSLIDFNNTGLYLCHRLTVIRSIRGLFLFNHPLKKKQVQLRIEGYARRTVFAS